MNTGHESLLEIMDSLAATVRDKNAALIRIVLNRGDEWLTREFIPASPCQNCYSVTKAFTATAVGIAQDKGYLKIDDPVLPYFGNSSPKAMSPGMERVTVRHLLAHLTGISTRYLRDADKFDIGTDDWLSYCLTLPLDHEPGEHYAYSNSNYYLLSCLVHRTTGMSLAAFLYENLFRPLGIRDFAWAACPYGEHQGGSGLYVTAQDMAKIGILYLHDGLWEGTRILSEEWTAEATRNQVAHTGSTYGLGVSAIYETGFAFTGAYGQAVIVRRDGDLVAAAQAFDSRFDIVAALDDALRRKERL